MFVLALSVTFDAFRRSPSGRGTPDEFYSVSIATGNTYAASDAEITLRFGNVINLHGPYRADINAQCAGVAFFAINLRQEGRWDQCLGA